MTSENGSRFCFSCKQTKASNDFYQLKSGKNSQWCKECRRKYSREYYYAHAEKAKQRQRQRVADNPDGKRQDDRLYYIANKDRIKKRVEKRTATIRGTPHFRRYMCAASARRRARVRGLQDRFTTDDQKRALSFFGNRCAVCSVAIGLSVKVNWDHWIPISSRICPGTVPSNMVPLCDSCNKSKNAARPSTWIVLELGVKCGLKRLKFIEDFLRSLMDPSES